MPRTKYETIMLRWDGANPDVVQPQALHPDKYDCKNIPDEDMPEGCRYCQEELDDVTETISAIYREKGREVIDTFHSNNPENDGFWEFGVESKKL